MKTPKPISKLINHFERLPGIGPKTAQRLVFHLLHFPTDEIEKFAEALVKFKTDTVICEVCKNVGEFSPCEICTDGGRSAKTIAVVSTPLDVFALERAGFKGHYHVLHGLLDPLNNIGPDELFVNELISRLKNLTAVNSGLANSALSSDDSNFYDFMLDSDSATSNSGGPIELIMATNTSMEGESTAMYLTKLIRKNDLADHKVKITRIARGLPVGGDIEYADDVTLLRALEGRSSY